MKLRNLTIEKMTDKKHWYALYIRARHEKKVLKALEERQIDCYLPLKKQIRQWHDRKKEVEEPLIPGYLFVYIDIRFVFQVLVVPGVLKLVTFSNQPALIPDYQIRDLQIFLEQSQLQVEVCNEHVRKGQLVRICNGPLANAVGQIQRVRGKKRIVVGITALGCTVYAELGLEEFELVEQNQAGKLDNPAIRSNGTKVYINQNRIA